MPNKFGRSVPVNEFSPKGILPEGLPDVARPSGSHFEEAAAAADKVASAIGKIADQAAAVEGKRAGAAAGNEPAYRPTGGASIRARAFDESATKTYLHNLDARMMTDMQATYEKHQDDPAALGTALDDLHKRMAARDVFPEVQGSFNESFTKLANAYRRTAATRAESKARDQLLADSIASLSDINTTVKRQVAGLDPNAPETEIAIENGVKRTTSIYDDLAARGAITQVAAEKSRAATRNDAYGELVIRRAGALKTPDEIATFRKDFERDFAAGKYGKKLDGDGFDRVSAELVKLENGAATAARANQGALRRGFDSFVEREAAGLKPSADEWTALVVQASGVPDGDRMIALAAGKRQLASRLSASSVVEGDAMLQRLREEARTKGGSPDHAELIKFGQKYLEEERKGLTTDQLGFAQKKGLIATVTPVDFEGFATAEGPAAVDAFAGQISGRVAQAQAVGTTLSRDAQYFRPEEKARLKEIVDHGGDRALALATAIVKGGGEAAPAMLHQIAPDAPKLAQIGAVLLDGGSLAAMRDALTPSHLEKTKGVKFKALDSRVEQPTASGTLGQSYLWAPGNGTRVRAVAEQIAQVRMMRENITSSDNPSRAKEIYERALKEATGAVFVGDTQYGGVTSYSTGWFGTSGKVIAPPGLRADRFGDAIGAITTDDLKALPRPPARPDGKEYSARDLQDALPVRAGNGYAFARKNYVAGGDNQFILDKSGKPFVLDWADVEPKLRQRRPDLFLGGR